MLVAREPNLQRTVKYLGQLGLHVVGLDSEADTEHGNSNLTGPTAIVVGSEGEGMSRQVRSACDETIGIPMFGEIASLNASVSAAIVLYEAVQQRRATSGD